MLEYMSALEWRASTLATFKREHWRILNETYRLNRTPVTRPEIAEDMAITQLWLERADLYYWRPEMRDMVKLASDDYPIEADIPTREDFPGGPDGACFYFGKPGLIFERIEIYAIGWLLTCWEAGSLRLHLDMHGSEEHEPTGFALCMLGRIWEGGPDEVDGMKINGVVGVSYHGFGEPINDEALKYLESRGALKFLRSATSFLDQRIVVSPATDVDRPTRRRVERAGGPVTPVRVIELRRRESIGHSSGGSSPVDWSCQWAVGGHWRKQYFPSTGGHKTIRIWPYVKGPADKPFRADTAPRLFKVAR